MAKMQSTFTNMVLVLCTITAVAGAALGYVYDLTKEPIAQAAAKKQQEAIEAVLPKFDTLGDEIIYTLHENTPESITLSLFPATLGGEFVGAAVKSSTMNGFAGKIEIMVGFNAAGIIENYSVLQHAETPGLGSKMQEWFRTSKGKQSILGLNPQEKSLTVSKDGGDVDAITAATISSRAFLGAVQTAYDAFTESQVSSKQ